MHFSVTFLLFHILIVLMALVLLGLIGADIGRSGFFLADLALLFLPLALQSLCLQAFILLLLLALLIDYLNISQYLLAITHLVQLQLQVFVGLHQGVLRVWLSECLCGLCLFPSLLLLFGQLLPLGLGGFVGFNERVVLGKEVIDGPKFLVEVVVAGSIDYLLAGKMRLSHGLLRNGLDDVGVLPEPVLLPLQFAEQLVLGLLLQPNQLVDLREDRHLLRALAGQIVRLVGHIRFFLEVGAVFAEVAEAVLVPRLLEGLLDVLLALLGCEFLVDLCLQALQPVQVGLVAGLEGRWSSQCANWVVLCFNDLRSSFSLYFHRLDILWQLHSLGWLWLLAFALLLGGEPALLMPGLLPRLLLADFPKCPSEQILEFSLLGRWAAIILI